MSTPYDREALREFSRRLPKGARVLDAGCGSGKDLEFFAASGYSAEGFDPDPANVKTAAERAGVKTWRSDFLFLSLPRETYDGIWSNRSMLPLSATGWQRILATFFQGLKKGGFLFVSIEEPATARVTDPTAGPDEDGLYRWPKDDFASLIRQSGFRLLAEGRNLEHPNRIGFIAERI